MRDRLRALLRFGAAGADAAPVPERLTYVVGDIHGCNDLLDLMLARIEADRGAEPADIVFLGDYVDRGPASASVLKTLRALALPGATVTCLMGNHERMMLDFLADPDEAGTRWLVNGGRETVESYAPRGWQPDAGEGFERACRDLLMSCMAAEELSWLSGLPLQWRSGSLGCVHAITDPRTDWDAQTEQTLLWGRPRPNMPRRADGLWVAHGHTVVPAVALQNGRIALDTGACFTGVLSAVRLQDGQVKVVSVSASA